MDNLSVTPAFNGLELVDYDESISVSQLNKLAKTLLENNMPIVWIKGEISGIRTYNHVYFDLKDEGAKVSCVVFSGLLKLIDFKLENGHQIEVRGKVTVYPQNGSYQINVERIRKVGLGELWEAYNKLLVKLRLEGLFDDSHKQQIPVFPRAIGVITSSVGAVIRDVITTLKRRMPNIPIIVYHTAVQGSDAGMQIAKAIKTANKRNEVDVLIVCRGGGSMEDLWCFNEEVVAREVFACTIPVISAVGHETDTTIIDFVADLRAPTPTAAAELVAKSKLEWENHLMTLHNKLYNSYTYIIDNCKKQLNLYVLQFRHLNPINQLQEKHIHLKNVIKQLNSGLKQLVSYRRNQLDLACRGLVYNKLNLEDYRIILTRLHKRLVPAMTQLLLARGQQLTIQLRQLELVNPSNILARGYAIVRNEDKQVIYSSQQLKDRQQINIVLHDDEVQAIIKKSPVQDELI